MKSPTRFGVLLLRPVFVALAPAAQAEFRVAVVDVQRAVMGNRGRIQRAQANLKKLFESRQKELDKKQQDLLKQREELEKQGEGSAERRASETCGGVAESDGRLQTVFMQYNQELEKEQKKATDPIVEKVLGIVKRLALTKQFDSHH